MASGQARALVERSAWIAIYAGILAIILGIVSGGVHVIAGWSLGVLGAIAVIAGIVLIVVRSQMNEEPASGAQSSPPSQGPQGNP
jgi:uncharacterized membrane protein HdeD (DUF308 family)